MHGIVMAFGKRNAGKLAGTILDVGSYNVNGTIRDVIPVTLGVDMQPGPCVDQVLDATKLLETFGPGSWDNVISNDALEHMEDWHGCLTNMWGVLKPGGVFLISMANPKKGYHGYPSDYWRWTLESFIKLFGKNQIIDQFEGGPSMGIVTRKEHPLDLTVKPYPVR
jgi:SAM-dependent methyltransferase